MNKEILKQLDLIEHHIKRCDLVEAVQLIQRLLWTALKSLDDLEQRLKKEIP